MLVRGYLKDGGLGYITLNKDCDLINKDEVSSDEPKLKILLQKAMDKYETACGIIEFKTGRITLHNDGTYKGHLWASRTTFSGKWTA